MNKPHLPLLFLAVGLVLGLMVLQGRNSPPSPSPQATHPMKEIYLAGGCFWGTEHFFKQVRGIIATEVGYANGHTSSPTYEEVCQHSTGFAETVHLTYAPDQLELSLLLQLYFRTINPTTLNRQGGDIGDQYRTGIYYTDSTDRPVIEAALRVLQKQYTAPIVIECEALRNFYTAEEYHQDYLEKHPAGYCHIRPELFSLARQANPYRKPEDSVLRQRLTATQYAVTQQGATEHPFDNDYWDEHREGIYVDITTGQPLFISTDKFDSGCGWPSFSRPIEDSLLTEQTDHSLGMRRIEVRSKTGNAHLGHVFDDGPQALGGLRYCINSAALRFIPKEQMQATGYGKYLPLLRSKTKPTQGEGH